MRNSNRSLTAIFLILIVVGTALWINFVPGAFLGRDTNIRLGLDLQGGTQVMLVATKPGVTADEMRQAAGTIERRVNGLGVGEAVVQLALPNRIIVELPGVANPQEAVETLRGTGQLEFIDPQGAPLGDGTMVRTSGNPNPVMNANPLLNATSALSQTSSLSGTSGVSSTGVLTPTVPQPQPVTGPIYTSITDGGDLDTSQVQRTYETGGVTRRPAVSFAFRAGSADRLAQFSTQNIGKQMCIVLDNRVFSCPVIQAALTGGSGIISTNTTEEANTIFNQLKYGALPVPLNVETSRTVSATLGQDSVQASIIAGIVGLLVVALFMIFYYRLPGIIAVIALLIYTGISFALYRMIPVTLTLAGIAGFILSIGLAVDANVLIFARLKEELRAGRGIGRAMEAAFEEAWPAIRDSNASTLITCVILYMFGNSFGVSIIKGFALTLGLGIIVSMFTAIVISRTLLRMIVPLEVSKNLWWYEIDRADAPTATTSGNASA